jgi:uncharacterized protein YjbI with pentapeptide repeats
MSIPKDKKCKGHQACEREIVVDGLCRFHLPSDHRDALACNDYNDLLAKEVSEAKKNESGIYVFHWEGFNFPKDHVLFYYGVFDKVKDRLENGWFNISNSNIQNIHIGYKIKDLIISEATVHGKTMIPVIEIDSIIFRETSFRGKFHCASRTSEFDALRAIFDNEFSFGATISERARFSGCRFNHPCIFYGNTINPVFGVRGKDEFKVVGFNHSIFKNPSETIFQDVDLRKASFKSVSLVGAKFYNTDFFQKELGRNGLKDEIKELSRAKEAKRTKSLFNLGRYKSKLDDHALVRYRHLIHEYRQLRMAMEDSKDYEKAHDFYVGEMEMRQKRDRSFVISSYRLSSIYGTNYERAFYGLLVLLFIHFILTIALSSVCMFFCPDNYIAWGRLGDIIIYSLGTGTLQSVDFLAPKSFLQSSIDLVFRVFIAAQTAMFVLALRNKIKR